MKSVTFQLSLSLWCAAALAQQPAPAPVKPAEVSTQKLAEKPAEKPAEAPAKFAVRRVDLRGGFADLPEQGLDLTSLLSGGGAPDKDFYEMLGKLVSLSVAEGNAPIVFDLTEPLALNQPQLAEVERAIAKIRAAGKKTYAYLQGADTPRYQVAALCDEILLADMGGIELAAPSLSATYMKDLYDLLGIQYDVVRCGDFKGAAEPYMVSRMSEHLRAHYLQMITHMNGAIVQRIASRRNLRPERVRELQGRRLLMSEQAKAAGLVDKIVPWVGVEQVMAQVLGRSDLEFENVLAGKKKRASNPMTMLTELFAPKKEAESDGPAIAVLHLNGPIIDGDKAQAGSMVSGATVATIRALADDAEIKGVVARINSPGGSATASEAIRLALAELAAKKPLVFSMGYVAGSGGYWITCIGRPILAEVGTITGSIGVLAVKPNMGPLFRRVGMHEESIALDSSAELMSPARGWTDAEKAQMQEMVDGVYRRFIDNVARSRKLTAQEVLPLAGGRVYAGNHAVELRLVDKVGGLDDALAMVRQEAKLDAKCEVLHRPRPRSLADTFAESFLSVRALLPEGPARAVLARLGASTAAVTILGDALQRPGASRVWAFTPDFTVRQ
jgi:protease-4